VFRGKAMSNTLFGGIEAGGTKFICAVAHQPPELINTTVIETTTPQETLAKVCDFFFPYVEEGSLQSIGLASFGPIDIDVRSPTYGYITSTPKPNWQNTNILGLLKQSLGLPFAFHHDVSGSAIGESRWGAARGKDPSLYLTIGTGIGGGYIINGKPLSGLTILEMGHIHIPHQWEIDPFEGICPYHRDCFEGLASGYAIEHRLGQRGETLPDDHPFWEIEAEHIAHALVNYIFTLSPRKIVVGGGVMQRSFLFQMVRNKVRALINNYLQFDILLGKMEEYIVPPQLGKYSGVLGAIAMAMDISSTSSKIEASQSFVS